MAIRGKSNRVRIIGGEWRGRIVEFVDGPQLRPTKDLVRQTLFNWLQPRLPGSLCLDPFPGKGALGSRPLGGPPKFHAQTFRPDRQLASKGG